MMLTDRLNEKHYERAHTFVHATLSPSDWTGRKREKEIKRDIKRERKREGERDKEREREREKERKREGEREARE
jgi:hypothetical protein